VFGSFQLKVEPLKYCSFCRSSLALWFLNIDLCRTSCFSVEISKISLIVDNWLPKYHVLRIKWLLYVYVCAYQNEPGTERTNIKRRRSEIYKSRRIDWLGHVMRMDEKRTPKRILEWKPVSRRIIGWPRKRWIEDVEEIIQGMGIRGWRKLCKERMEWKRIIEKAKIHSGL